MRYDLQGFRSASFHNSIKLSFLYILLLIYCKDQVKMDSLIFSKYYKIKI